MGAVGEVSGTATALVDEILGRVGTASLIASRECFTAASGALLLNQAVTRGGKADAVEHFLGRPAHLAMGAGLGFLATAAVASTMRRIIGRV